MAVTLMAGLVSICCTMEECGCLGKLFNELDGMLPSMGWSTPSHGLLTALSRCNHSSHSSGKRWLMTACMCVCVCLFVGSLKGG